jgi:hypothetical protein
MLLHAGQGRMGGWAAVVLTGSLLGCTTPHYGPAFPLMPDAVSSAGIAPTAVPPALLPAVVPPRSPFADILPPPEEWVSWKPAPVTTVCTRARKGRQRVCRSTTPSLPAQALTGALVRATLRHTAGSNSAVVRYRLESNPRLSKIYEVVCAVKSPCQLWLPPGEELSAPPMLDTSEHSPQTWDVGEVGMAGPKGERQQILGLRPRSVMDPVFVTLAFQSGLALMVKLVSVEDGGMLAVSWSAPPPTTPPPLALEDRPPVVKRDRLFSGYQVQVKDEVLPPWMPQSVLDDGRVTLIKVPSLTGLRGPVLFGLTPTGDVRLTQFRLFVPPQAGTDGEAWLVLQGIWPAVKVVDADGLEVLIKRGDARAPDLPGAAHGF